MIKKEKYDVIVVGAGPAGTTAAREMAKEGVQVLLIDKKDFPRDKTCGGLIPIKALKELDFQIPEEQIEQKIKSLSVYSHRMKESVYTSEQLLGVTMQRRDFDYYLLNKAIGQGVRFYKKTSFQHLEKSKDEIKVYTSNGEYWCRTLVGSDGVFSKVKKYVTDSQPLDKHKMGFTLSANIKIRKEEFNPDFKLFSVAIPFSMGWGIPFREMINIGIGGPVIQKDKILKEFYDFKNKVSELYSFDTQAWKPKGYFLPAGGFKRRVAKENIYLIGDAAGLADPFTGEGIYYAIRSGKIIAQEIIGQRVNTYQQRYNDEFQHQLKKSLIQNILGFDKKYTIVSPLRSQLCNYFGKKM